MVSSRSVRTLLDEMDSSEIMLSISLGRNGWSSFLSMCWQMLFVPIKK